MSLLGLLSCRPASPLPKPEPSAALNVTKVTPARYEGPVGDAMEQACGDWRLTAQQVERFFQISNRYKESPYSRFYQVPCAITGELEAEGQAWKFTINGGATATWQRNGATRYWGCSAKACEPLVLMPTDFMNPGTE